MSGREIIILTLGVVLPLLIVCAAVVDIATR